MLCMRRSRLVQPCPPPPTGQRLHSAPPPSLLAFRRGALSCADINPIAPRKGVKEWVERRANAQGTTGRPGMLRRPGIRETLRHPDPLTGTESLRAGARAATAQRRNKPASHDGIPPRPPISGTATKRGSTHHTGDRMAASTVRWKATDGGSRVLPPRRQQGSVEHDRTSRMNYAGTRRDGEKLLESSHATRLVQICRSILRGQFFGPAAIIERRLGEDPERRPRRLQSAAEHNRTGIWRVTLAMRTTVQEIAPVLRAHDAGGQTTAVHTSWHDDLVVCRIPLFQAGMA